MQSPTISPAPPLSPTSRRVRKKSRRSSYRSPEYSRVECARREYSDNVVDIESARRQRRQAAAYADSVATSVESPAAFPVPVEETLAEKETSGCPPCHWGLMVLTLILAVLSIPIIYSASTANALEYQQNPDFFFWRQLGFVAVGLVLMLGASRMSARATRNFVWLLYFGSLAGLIAIEFTSVGVTMGGGQRWLKLGPIPLQVSEFAKIALIGVLADFWCRAAPSSQKSWWPWIGAAFITLPLAALVFIQPHLSATLLLLTMPFVLALYAPVPGRQWLKIVAPLLVLAIAVVFLCKSHNMPVLKTYQQDRVAAFLFAENQDARGANYQQLQGMRALSRGGLLGVGPGASLYKQGHLPAPHTDFVLAIIGEEWGLVGMLVLMALYGLLIFFCMQIGVNANTGFEALLCAGVGSLLGVQLISNAGIVTGMLPVTGIPLPLLSYGGSGLLCTLLGLGLVLAVSRRSGGALAATAVKSEAE